MTEQDAVVTWVDARERLPWSGAPVAAAITGRYPPECIDGADPLGEEFWLVRPMVFLADYWSEEDGVEHGDCFVDSDGVVRLPYGLDSEETVTHWAELPTLPGLTVQGVFGEDVQPALRNGWGAPPST